MRKTSAVVFLAAGLFGAFGVSNAQGPIGGVDPVPKIEICKLVSLTGGDIPITSPPFFDADDGLTRDGCDQFSQEIPTGVVGSTDASYAFVVTNVGTDVLTLVRVTDPTPGFDIAVDIGDLAPGESVQLTAADLGFENLNQPGICPTPGNKNNVAQVEALGEFSEVFVFDDDSATVNCVGGPAITLLKEVSIDGGFNFFPADTADTAPTGPLGTDAEYRFIVRNSGGETLIGAAISDPALNLMQVPVSRGPLVPGEEVIIQSPLLHFPDLCDSMGEKLNVAQVDAVGMFSGMPVVDTNPAIVNCAEPQIELLKQVSLDGGPFSDADTLATASVGLLGADATYRLIVRNIGLGTLENLVINDTTLGLLDVPVPGGPLAEDEQRTIDSGALGFRRLFVPERCNTVGNKLNIARVDADSAETGTPVSDDDPANVNCIANPAISLVKEVSVDGGHTFHDANMEASAPSAAFEGDALYRLLVTNVGDERLANVFVSDATLGISMEIGELAPGESVPLTSGHIGFENLYQPGRCDSTGNMLNIAEVEAIGKFSEMFVSDDDPAYVNCLPPPLNCELTVEKTCVVETPPGELLCEASINATTLRYTGPDLADATVRFIGKDHGDTTYTGVDLSAGLILTKPSLDGDAWTVDAETTGGVKLGSKTSIFINDELAEIIHTSCSAIYEAGQPAPLDANSPPVAGNPSPLKGDPSPNWEVVKFEDMDGGLVAEGSSMAASDCQAPFTGANVTYEYNVANTGTSAVELTSVYDDKLHELLSMPATLAVGASLQLQSYPVFIDMDTTNTVVASGNVAGFFFASQCSAMDSVTVTVDDPPVASCDDGKPVTLVFEYTGHACEVPPGNPQDGKFTCSGDPAGASQVQLVVDNATVEPAGESINVGDLVTVTALANKFDSQTNFEISQDGTVFQDLSVHLSCSKDLVVGDRFGSLLLEVFVPGEDGDKDKDKGKHDKGKHDKGKHGKGKHGKGKHDKGKHDKGKHDKGKHDKGK